MPSWSSPSHYAPVAVMRAVNEGADYKYYDADKMGLVCEEEGQVDWCCLRDVTHDEYQIMLDAAFVRVGFIEVDKPMKEGRGMFIAAHHSELLINEAWPAAKAGLWWHIQSRTYDFEKSLEAYQGYLNRDSMSKKTRDEIAAYIEQWRVMFPGDSRVEDFHTDFVLDMLTRRRVYRRETPDRGPMVVYFDRAEDA